MRNRNRVLLACIVCAASAVGLRAQEVGSSRVVPIQVTGDPAARFSLVILGDGYTVSEQATFRRHVERHLNVLWSFEPFRSYRNYINVYAVEIISAESGVTCDPAHREPRTTPLGLRFGGGCDNPNARGIYVDQEAARRYARLATPDYDQILTIANTDTYGGIGGATATTSGGNALGPYITPHELGHSLGRLQDEYTYSERGVRGPAYTGEEPASVHHTLMTEAMMRERRAKWYRWLGEPSEAGGTIGRYAGGMSRVEGVWRPSRHSMMISLGYAFDQVSRERMTQRISAQVELIAASTPVAGPVGPADVVWIETAHPVHHELDVTWRVDGQPVSGATNVRNLALRDLGLSAGPHTIDVTVVDPTPFVRDAGVRDTSFTATRSWTVGEAAAQPAGVRVAFTASTDLNRAVAGTEVVYVETTHPRDRALSVSWQLDGRAIANPSNRRSIALAEQRLAPGTHRLTAVVSDPAGAGAGADTLAWTVDNTGPRVAYTLADPVSVIVPEGATPHYFVRDHFTMKLDPTDDQPGFVVAEFRLNGDGWHQYYGWPDAPPETPFLFTARGTTIKELVYGSLGEEGLSPQPWEPREPGWGTHRIEYRARDAAGNIGETNEFRVTVEPLPACTATITGEHAGPLAVTSGVTCLDGATVTGPVTVAAGASLAATNATVRGILDAADARSVEWIGGRIDGELRIGRPSGDVLVFGAVVTKDVTVTGAPAGVRVRLAGNRIGGRLECSGNAAAPGDLGTPNSIVRGAAGQCAGH